MMDMNKRKPASKKNKVCHLCSVKPWIGCCPSCLRVTLPSK